MVNELWHFRLGEIAGSKGYVRSMLLPVFTALAICAPCGAFAAEIDLSPQVNANLSNYYNGSVYPANGGMQTIGGVNFNLAAYPNGGTGVVQATGVSSFTFTINEANVGTVYTIINSAYGQSGSTIGSLTFSGSAGASYTYDLTEGDNVRDHASTQFNTVAPNVYATKDYGSGDRLDVQKITLPGLFGSQMLDTITLTSTGNGGLPFLAAITTNAVSSVPLPASAPMFGAALVILGSVGYGLQRRSKAAS